MSRCLPGSARSKGIRTLQYPKHGGNLYVAFAKQDSEKKDEVAGAGLGWVDVFSPRPFAAST